METTTIPAELTTEETVQTLVTPPSVTERDFVVTGFIGQENVNLDYSVLGSELSELHSDIVVLSDTAQSISSRIETSWTICVVATVFIIGCLIVTKLFTSF